MDEPGDSLGQHAKARDLDSKLRSLKKRKSQAVSARSDDVVGSEFAERGILHSCPALMIQDFSPRQGCLQIHTFKAISASWFPGQSWTTAGPLRLQVSLPGMVLANLAIKQRQVLPCWRGKTL